MANKKISEMTELASTPSSGDLIEIVDVSDTSEAATGTNKKVQYSNLVPPQPAASDTVPGIAELATTAETTTGTDATRAVTPKGLHDMTSLSGAAWFKDEDNMASDSATTVPSQQSVKAYGDRALNPTLNIHPLYAPPGFVINGKILVTDTGSGINVALKTFANADPSATDPVYIPIGNSVRILSAHGTNYLKDVTIPDGVNTFNSGSAELATKEIDYFVYACYSSLFSLTQLLISRFPGARVYGDFSTTATNEKYAAYYSGIQPSTSDTVEVIGRFAATLSAGAGYTWSVPTFTAANLIQRPIYETRYLEETFSIGNLTEGNAVGVQKYKVIGNMVHWTGTFQWGTTTSASGTIQFVPPFISKWAATPFRPVGTFYALDSGTRHYTGTFLFLGATNYAEAFVEGAGTQQIANNYPITWATGDIWSWSITYEI